MNDVPSKEIQERNDRVSLLNKLGYKWSGDGQLYYDWENWTLAPLSRSQGHELAKRIMREGLDQ